MMKTYDSDDDDSDDDDNNTRKCILNCARSSMRTTVPPAVSCRLLSIGQSASQECIKI